MFELMNQVSKVTVYRATLRWIINCKMKKELDILCNIVVPR